MKQVIAAALIICCLSVYAQKPIYKCTIDNKVSYSNEPCVGAKMIDATPTLGAEYTGKKSLPGAMRDLHEATRDALRPITGMDIDSYHKMQDRGQMSPADRIECYKLDNEITVDPKKSKVEIFQAREKYRKLNC